jgi:hypothetical protein
MELTDQVRERVRAFAHEMREEFGPLGAADAACLLEAAEDWGVLLGDELARAVTEQELPAAADTADSAVEAACPKCQRLGRWKGPRKRRVETRRGAIHVSEPEYYCHHCRRSFFPSDARVGDGA